MTSSSSTSVQKCLKSDIVFLRYGNFIDYLVTDRWKFDFEKTLLKIANLGKVLVLQQVKKTNKQTIFTWKHWFYIKSLKYLLIKYWIINLAVKFQNQPWDHINFWLWTTVTQNQVF